MGVSMSFARYVFKAFLFTKIGFRLPETVVYAEQRLRAFQKT